MSPVEQTIDDDGDIFRFNAKTKEFGILSSGGKIRTYYVLNPSMHPFLTNQDYSTINRVITMNKCPVCGYPNLYEPAFSRGNRHLIFANLVAPNSGTKILELAQNAPRALDRQRHEMAQSAKPPRRTGTQKSNGGRWPRTLPRRDAKPMLLGLARWDAPSVPGRDCRGDIAGVKSTNRDPIVKQQHNKCPVCGYPELYEPAYSRHGKPSFALSMLRHSIRL